MHCEHESPVDWIPYFSSRDEALDIPARETMTVKTTASDVQVQKWVGLISVVLMPGHQKTLAEAANAVRSELESSADFPDLYFDVHFVEDEIAGKDWT